MKQFQLILYVLAILWQFCDNACAQLKIDSIVVRIDNMLIDRERDTISAGVIKSFDTVNKSVKINFDGDLTTVVMHDTFTFHQNGKLINNNNNDFSKNIQLILDTIHNQIISFAYGYGESGGSIVKGELSFVLKDVPYALSENNYQIDLNHIPDSAFYYNTKYLRNEGNGYIGSIENGAKIGNGINKVTIYTSPSLSTVRSDHSVANIFTCYPNPASSYINILLPKSSPKEIVIFDLLGRNVYRHDIVEGEDSIPLNISPLPPGIYYLRAGNQMQKFVIQR